MKIPHPLPSISTSRTFAGGALALLASGTLGHSIIMIPSSGTVTFDFATAPATADISTFDITPGDAATITTPELLDTAVNALDATTLLTPLALDAVPPVTPPAVSRIGRYSGALQNIGTTPTGAPFSFVMANLQNATGAPLTSLPVSYTYQQTLRAGATPAEEIPGLRAYYNPTGAPSAWVNIPAFSIDSTTTPQTLETTLDFSATPIPSLGQFYILWADDNGSAGGDRYNSIDNLVFGIPEPTSALLTLLGSASLLARRRKALIA